MMRAIILTILLALPQITFAQGVRIKDISTFEGVRTNALVGYGLVVGLDGTGDSLRNSPFTEDKMVNILERLGVNIVGEQFRAKNVASVIVTATLTPFARAGSKVDLTVSAIGDAGSLRGGTLIMTPLSAADGLVYAVGQGSIIAGGAAAEGDAARVVRGVPTSGHIPSGAIVEREVPFEFSQMTSMQIALNTADFSTARKLETAINSRVGASVATMRDAATISLDLSALRKLSPAQAVAEIENISIQPESSARVIIDQRSGTIVMSEDVRVSRIALSKGQTTITVEEQPLAVQPNPFSDGETIVVPRTRATIEDQQQVPLVEIQTGISLTDVVAGLNAIGVNTDDLIDILKTLKAAGALHAELVVM